MMPAKEQGLAVCLSVTADSQGGVEVGMEVTAVDLENTVVLVTEEGPAETKGVLWENDPRREIVEVDNSSLCEVETTAEKRVSLLMYMCVCVCVCVCVCLLFQDSFHCMCRLM